MEGKESQISRRTFVKILPPLIAGGAIVAGIGSWVTSSILGKRIEELLSVNEKLRDVNAELFELSRSQEDEIAKLLQKRGALKVEVRGEESEAQAAMTKLSEIATEATQTAWNLKEYRVQATAEAYQQDQEALQEIMGKLPPSLIQNSIKVMFNSSNGSGVVTYHDRAEENLIFLTAGHIVKSFEGDPVSRVISEVIISQPHLHWQDYVASVVSIDTHPESDLGIVTVDTRGSRLRFLPREALDGVRINESWEPIIGEELYSLSFPDRARHGIGFTPSVFNVVGKEDGGIAAITDSLVGKGASGAPVAKADGTVVGIYVAVGKQGNFVLPIRDSYRELLGRR